MKKESGIAYFLMALAAFAGLGLEVLVGLVLEPMIYGVQMNDWTTAQNISHWIITCILWGIVAVCILQFAKKKYSFELFTIGNTVKLWQWVLIIIFITINMLLSYKDFNGFKVIKEFHANGWLKFIFQYIYYIFETILITLIIIFAQKAFDTWFHKVNIPFGGIVLALTWGVSHCLTKDLAMGIICLISATFFGCIYLLVDRDLKKAFPLLLLSLIL